MLVLNELEIFIIAYVHWKIQVSLITS